MLKVQYSHFTPLSIKLLRNQMSNMQQRLIFIHFMMMLVMTQNYNFWNFIVFLFYSACVFILREETWLCKTNSGAESSFWKWEFCFHIECSMLGLLIVENKGFIFFLDKKLNKSMSNMFYLCYIWTVVFDHYCKLWLLTGYCYA